MPAKKRAPRRGAAEWAAILARMEASGLGTMAFCRREGLAASSVQRWRQRLGGREPGRFIELASLPVTPAVAESTFEISFPGGVTVRWRA